MTPFIASLLVKLTLILALGLIAARSFRSFGPALRHQVLLVTLGSCLVLPLALVLAPQWDVRVLQPVAATDTPAAIIGPDRLAPDIGQSTAPSQPASSVTDATAPSSGPWSLRAMMFLVWAVGFLAVLIWLTAGRIRLRRIAAGSWPLRGSDWDCPLAEEMLAAGVSRPVRLLSSSVVSTPLTWGWRAPVILFPEDALDWSDAHRRVVLRHELAHVARGDALSQLGTGFVCALYWFHPLVWVAERRLRAECERACDDRVVSLGTPAAEYAAHLLEVARSARSFGAPGFLSVAMARPSQLEGRLLAVLSGSRRRASPSRGARAAALLATLVIFATVSAFRPVPRPAPLAAPSMLATPSIMKAVVPSASAPRADRVVNTYAVPGDDNPRPAAIDSTFQRSAPAQSGGTLNIDLETGGSLNITGWDQQRVLVKASLRGRSWRDTDVNFQAGNGGARLESHYTGDSKSQSNSHVFDIQVPRSFNVRISSSGGSISISGVDGVFSGNTGGGRIEIRNARGEARIATGGGDIRVSDSRLAGSVSTGGGTIIIERVSGNLRGDSGSGPVTYINSEGGKEKSEGKGTGAGKGSGFGAAGIRMNSGGGAISVPEAPDGAHVTTGGGRIRIGPSGGEVYAQTGGGNIDIGPARGSVEAVTGGGDVTIELTGAGSHAVRVNSGKGEVTLVLPEGLDAMLDLETAYTDNLGHKTRIVSDWPLQITETDSWDRSMGTARRYVRARQPIGRGGEVIRVRTVNGNVVLRRGR
jgi:beta-lactamase regulating signal transducer with metallopeptidase domain